MIEWLKNKLKLNSENNPRRVVATLIILVICCFLSVSFISFLFTWDYDQSELHRDVFDIILQENDNEVDTDAYKVKNSGGILGAYIAKFFIHDTFGIASFALIFALLYIAFRIWWEPKTTNESTSIIKQYKKTDSKVLLNTFMIMFLLSITLGLICNTLCDGNICGNFGYQFSYILLPHMCGNFMTGLLILALILGYVFIAFNPKFNFNLGKKETKPLENKQEETLEQQVANEDTPISEQNTPANPFLEQTSLFEDENIQPLANEQEETFTELEQEPVQEPLADPIETIEEHNDENVAENPQLELENPEENIDEEQEEEEQPQDENNDEETEDDNDTSLDPNDEDEEASAQELEEVDDESQHDIAGMQITNTNTAVVDTSHIEMEMQDYDPKADLSHFKQPGVDLLKIYDNDREAVQVDEDEQLANKNLIESTLLSFGVEIESITATVGPTITLYEIVPKAGTRITRIQTLEKDIMMSLSALGIRIIAPIPGKGTVGIEVPNKKRQTVSMYSVINSQVFKESKMELPVALGKTITNDVYMFDLAKMPHLLVAGATGQGKSVGLNAIITSLLYKKHPSQLKFVLVDPKMVEFSIYGGLIKHYMAQYPGEENIILTDCAKVLQTLKSLVQEMEDRYKLLMDAHCRNIIEYNEKFIHRELNPNKGHKYLCYMVIIIDEFGDFIMQAGKEIETPIARIAQKARAVGMHLILATQRPSVNVITGIIKANIPGRIAFRTSSGVDSKTILDAYGAEGLVGKGDLLVSNAGAAPERVQCAFVDTPEVERIVNFISKQQGYGEPMQLPEVKEQNQDGGAGSDSDKGGGEIDALFEDAARVVVIGKSGSTSAIQRKFSVGYNRAGRIMDQLEYYKIVGAYNGAKARDVLVDEMGLEQLLDDLRNKGLLK